MKALLSFLIEAAGVGSYEACLQKKRDTPSQKKLLEILRIERAHLHLWGKHTPLPLSLRTFLANLLRSASRLLFLGLAVGGPNRALRAILYLEKAGLKIAQRKKKITPLEQKMITDEERVIAALSSILEQR